MFRRSQDEDVYEYVYPRKKYRKTLWTCVWMWVAILVVRLICFSIWGYQFAIGPWNLASLGISGILVGVIIQSVRVLHASTHIGEMTTTGELEIDHSLTKPQ